MIISGKLEPGASIAQGPLVERLEVSRTPLRRALVELERDGFIHLGSHSGARVRKFSLEEVFGIFEGGVRI